MSVNGAALIPTICGALFWPAERILIVADLHLEKGTSFARRGALLPPYDTRATLERLAAAIERYSPLCVISLGDAFHDCDAESRIDETDAARLERMVAGRNWIWVLGNHDPAPPRRFGGEVALVKRIGPLVFRHEPTAGAAIGEIAGHLHPCARIRADGAVLRRRCHASDGGRAVLPAYGAYAGGLNVLDDAFRLLFETITAWALGANGVYPIPTSRLLPDAPASSDRKRNA
jgi:DNA ligase-associated metallophosphoesterase